MAHLAMAYTEYAQYPLMAGKYQEAERAFIAALAASWRYLGESHPETHCCRLALIELYEAWGKPNEAEKWRANLPQTGATKE